MPLGIAAAHRPRLYAALRPVLDLMQTLPTFVYLIPTLVLFGLGVVPGLISTVIFALPAPIRLTHLGISSVPQAAHRGGRGLWRHAACSCLWKVELPSAASTIIAGITQCIMLSLSMVVIAALVGAGGLGVPVVRALNSVQVGMGFEAGFTIVLLAIILDRISRPKERGRRHERERVEFQAVDILFCAQPGRDGRRLLREALARPRCRRYARAKSRPSTASIVGVAGANLKVGARRDLGADGTLRLGQVHAAARGQRIEPGDARARCSSVTASPPSMSRPATAGSCAACAANASPWYSSSSLCCPGARCARTSGLAWSCAARRPRSARRIVDEKLELVGLTQWAERVCRANCPGGMQQRVGLARAFATDADILLMDEPFSALDPLIRAKLQDELLELQARVKKTILFVSHDLDEALRLGDHISILQNGRIIQTGTAEDIVLAPADDYVAEFVRHMNPLTVLTGSMIMRRRAALEGVGDRVWLDAGRRYQLTLSSADEALSVHIDGIGHALRHLKDEAELARPDLAHAGAAPGLAVVPAGVSLQSIIHLRHTTGHPVLLAEAGRIIGVCGEIEILRALSGGSGPPA